MSKNNSEKTFRSFTYSEITNGYMHYVRTKSFPGEISDEEQSAIYDQFILTGEMPVYEFDKLYVLLYDHIEFGDAKKIPLDLVMCFVGASATPQELYNIAAGILEDVICKQIDTIEDELGSVNQI